MSGYLMEPIRGNDDFKGAARYDNNGQIGPTWQKGKFSKETAVLTPFFKLIGDIKDGVDFSHVRVLHGTN